MAQTKISTLPEDWHFQVFLHEADMPIWKSKLKQKFSARVEVAQWPTSRRTISVPQFWDAVLGNWVLAFDSSSVLCSDSISKAGNLEQ